MPITPLPDPPSRQDPANFSARADAFLAALQVFSEELAAASPGESAAGLAIALSDSATLGQGATLVAVRDAGGYFSASTAEAVFQEIGVSLGAVAASVAALSRSISGATALRGGRTAPHANFAWFTADFTVTGCAGAGRATVLQDLGAVFLTKYGTAMSGVVKYVAPYGNDTLGTGDSWASPYKTIDKATRSTTCGTIYLWPGVYEIPSFRYNDTAGDRPKVIKAPFGGVTVATTGTATTGTGPISDATWTADVTYPNVYYCTITTASPQPTPIRVLLAGTVDKYGEAMPMPKCSSIATVDSGGFGWWYDSATRRLYVRKGLENVNVTTKAGLSAVYALGGDNAMLLYSSISYWEGITFHGYANVLKLAGQIAPEGWFKDCTFKYAESNTINVYGGGAYTQGCRAYRSAADHANYNTADGTTAYGAEINYVTQFAGDPDTFPIVAGAQATNPITSGMIKNGSSNHNGYVVRINGRHDDVCGPPIADTVESYTWNLGVATGYSYATGASKYGWIIQGSTARAWLDGCSAEGGNLGIDADDNAVVNTFNCFGSQTATSGGTFAAYVPA